MSAVRRLRTREKGRNSRSRSPAAMPMPWSRDAHDRAARRRGASRGARRRPSGEYFTAFETRLSSTSARRSRSAQHGSGSSGMSDAPAGAWRASGRRPTTSRTTAARSTTPNSNGKCPVSRRVRLQGLVHEVRHVGGGVDDGARLLHALLPRRVRPPLQQLGVAEHARQRRAEVVGHDVHELALHAVQLDELGVGALEGLVQLGVAQDDADPVGQRLEGDDLARGRTPPGASLSTFSTATTSSPDRMGIGDLAAGRRDEADVVGVGGDVGDVTGSLLAVGAPGDALVHGKRPLRAQLVAGVATAVIR